MAMQPITTSERKCVIKGCGNISMFKQSHQFPSMPDRCLSWLEAIGDNLDDELLGLPPEKFKRRIVCVEHFDPSCISKQSQRFLKRTAVPTIFNGLNPDGTPRRPHAPTPLQPTRMRQHPVTYRTIVIPNTRPETKQKSFYINKTSEPAGQPSGPTLLIEPLGCQRENADKGLHEGTQEPPMYYMTAQHQGMAERGKPALKITKVYPNRKAPRVVSMKPDSSVETLLVEREDFPCEYLEEDWQEQMDVEHETSGFQDQHPLVLESEHIFERRELDEVEESVLPMGDEDWTLTTADGETVNNNVLERKFKIRKIRANIQPIYVAPIARCADSTSELPHAVKYLLVGGGAASVAAFRTLRKYEPDAGILVVTEEYAFPYKKHLISKPKFWRSKVLDLLDDVTLDATSGDEPSIFYSPPSSYTEPRQLWSGGTGVARGCTVRSVCPRRRLVTVSSPGRPDRTLQYHKCMLATGTRAANVSVLENAEAGVSERCVFPRTLHDAKQLRRRLEAAHAVAVIGAGLLGVEIVNCLVDVVSTWERKPQISHIFREAAVLWRVLPDYLAHWVMHQQTDVALINNTEVLNAYMKNERVTLELSNAEVLEVDLVVVCVGSVPNTEYAAASGLEVHPQLGGIIVNSDFCVCEHLYAAGDVACYYTPRCGRRRVEHVTHAAATGHLCARRMCGAPVSGELPAPEVRCRLGDYLSMHGIGVIDSNLEMVGAFPNLTQNDRNYDSGVVFYLQQREVVGVLLWNLPGRERIARELLHRQEAHDGEFADLVIANTSPDRVETDESRGDEIGTYDCAHCEQRFPARRQIVRHLREAHAQQYACGICGGKFNTVRRLSRHYAAHFTTGLST